MHTMIKTKGMKKILIGMLSMLLLSGPLFAQLDRSQRPQPGPPPTIQLGEFSTFSLDNGLRVILVENHQMPMVSFQLTLDIDPILEGEAKGFVDLGGSLLREGTLNRSKQEIDESIDFIGASLSTHSRGIFASSLIRHQETLLELMSDILLNPSFPESELQRLITQNKSALATVRTDANAMARNVATAVVYGENHPYGEVITEESLDQINVDLIQAYYDTFFRPNVAYLVIVGNVRLDEARELSQRHFGSWEPAEVPRFDHEVPQPPDGIRVAFVERPGAIQSVVNVTHPVELRPGSPDAIPVSVMNGVLGGGAFSGRLMQNLREDKGYTYGARSSLSPDRLVGRFSAGTEVRNSVTDSTVVEILYEMERMIQEPVDAHDLELTKNFMTGTFARSLEHPRIIANFALNIARYGLPDDYYATYLERLDAVTPAMVQGMAAKYLRPDQAHIVVAGNREEVAELLLPFTATGSVDFFDPFGQPLPTDLLRPAPSGMTAENVLERYFEALGGKNRIEGIEDITQEMRATVMGQQITIRSYKKAPNLMLMKTLMGTMTLSQQLFDGQKGVLVTQMGRQEFTDGPEFEQMKMQATLNHELHYRDYGIRKELLGIEHIDGRDAYKVEAVSSTGTKTHEYYDLETGLKTRSVSEAGVTEFNDYREVNGLLFPHHIIQEAGPQLLQMELTDIQINTGLGRDVFVVQ